jgi:hypothetical protein
MVQRAQLLLNRCVMILLMGALTACSVDTLKIYVPPRGIESIHQEDLKRALWNLERGTESMLWWENRASQVNLRETDIHGCFIHEGRTSDVLTVVALATSIEVATVSDIVDVESNFVDVNFTLWAQQIREGMKQKGLE